MTTFKTISVIGLGYIGLPTAAVFAARKIKVIGVDVNAKAVDTINQGKIHIMEPDLDMVVHAAVSEGYLRATTTPEPADAFLVAVPTPFRGDDHEPDLTYIQRAAEAIAPVLQKGNLVVLESTSPVGATEQMEQWLAAIRPDLTFPSIQGDGSDIRVAHCPERVLPGQVMRELVENDRVIGGISPACSKAAVDLYRVFVKGDCIVTNARTAEMAKLTENSFRDVNIAFANELSVICDRLDIDVWELIALANRHPRVNILKPGPGVGGHCIAVDPWFIVNKTPELARLIRTAREVNDAKPQWVVDKVHQAIGACLTANPTKTAAELTIVCYGMTFKADIDDIRESPSIEIARRIKDMHAGKVFAVEPNVGAIAGFDIVPLDEGMRIGDIHVILVNHRQFAGLAPDGQVVAAVPV